MSKPFTASDDVVPGEAYQTGYREGYDNALAEQPFDRAAIIEECVSVAAWYAARGYTPSEIIKAIAALKDKQ